MLTRLTARRLAVYGGLTTAGLYGGITVAIALDLLRMRRNARRCTR
ncbi:hypothetical protein [Terrabacter terrigena]|uniref:Uncharacterized protein n=1 Tax=Terrabacter terrigena TaxID=574718 RepID=A0ABW3MY15_9MICO